MIVESITRQVPQKRILPQEPLRPVLLQQLPPVLPQQQLLPALPQQQLPPALPEQQLHRRRPGSRSAGHRRVRRDSAIRIAAAAFGSEDQLRNRNPETCKTTDQP